MELSVIRSSENQHLHEVRQLLRGRKHREAAGGFVIEGFAAIRDWAALGGSVRYILQREDLRGEAPCQAPTHRVESALFDRLAPTTTPRGWLAVGERKQEPFDALLERLSGQPCLVACFDRIADPGNLGTMVRTAAAFGFGGAVTTPGCVDPYNPKVVRSSAGALARLAPTPSPILGDTIDRFEAIGCRSVILDPRGSRKLEEVEPAPFALLVVGNESRGIEPDSFHPHREPVRIVQEPGIESLNAAMAFGIAAWWLARR